MNMKYSIIVVGIFLFTFATVRNVEALTINGTYDAFMTAGEAVDLNWDSQNTINRVGDNTYPGKPRWYAGSPVAAGKISYPAGELITPGYWSFTFSFLDDDTPASFWDEVFLTIYPLPPVSTNAPTCNAAGTTATLSWNPSANSTGGYVEVTKPAGTPCPASWSGAAGGTSCTTSVSGSSASFQTSSGVSYSNWTVFSRAGSLQSLTSVAGSGFSCNAVSVNLDF